MRRHTVTALAVLALLPLAACGGNGKITTDEVSYTIDEPVTSLVVGARAASVTIEAGDGPVTVTEAHRYSAGKPGTAHEVQGQTLRLTETGCSDDNVRCEIRYKIRMPAATSAEITAQAGAVHVTGLGGTVHITTQAGAVEGKALASDEVIVTTQAGAASLEFAEAPSLMKANTELGAVEVRVPSTEAYAVAADTDVGKAEVSVRHDPASLHKIQVKTGVGAVTIEPLS
jgi:hypothetical protein